jgi:hypothetical protein
MQRSEQEFPRQLHGPGRLSAADLTGCGSASFADRIASTRVASALRMAALSLRHSETALGAYYRSIARRTPKC